MAFLYLKKSHHINKPLHFQLLVNPIEVEVVRNEMYDKNEYKIPAKNAGQTYNAAPTKDGNVYTFNRGQEFTLLASEALYKHLSIYEKGSLITIKMVPNEKGGVVWDVEPMQKTEQNKTDLINKINKPSDTDLAIKWGMAFNNATRLVSSIPLHADESVEDKVGLIGKLTPEMFQIACNMPDQKPKEDDDVPF